MSGFFLIPKKGTGGGAEAIPLIVTCSSQFAGTTITASDGTSTLTETCPSTSPYEITFILPNDGSWTISGTASGQTFTTSIVIQPYETELNAIPEGSTVLPTDNIQTWLFCAGIFDKAYTTISEVLNDATTVTTLIASNNASDYLARSTTWASDVCADSSAMTKIGANDYCSDQLLSDSTWLSAICNSTYFESVLNVKVPTMTSNIAPSGNCFGSSVFSTTYKYYYMFDNDASTAWYPQSGSQVGQYVGYQFTSPVKVYKAVYSHESRTNTAKFKFRASNNGTDYTDISNVIDHGSFADYRQFSEILNNNNAYQYYELYITQGEGDNNGAGFRGNSLQFYGRATS